MEFLSHHQDLRPFFLSSLHEWLHLAPSHMFEQVGIDQRDLAQKDITADTATECQTMCREAICLAC